jgi:hypothetical protein
MEVRRGLVYPRQILLDDIQIDASSYVVVKVDMVHENSKNLKLEVLPDNMTQTLQDAITKRVQWRRTSIDVDPLATASASATASQPNTTPTSIFPNTQPDQMQMQPYMSPIREKTHPSPPQTLCTPLPAPGQMRPPTAQPKTVKNVRGKTQSQQRKMLSKAIMGKQPLQQTTAMTQANPNFVVGRPMLTTDKLHKAGQPCIDLHNHYI